MTGIKNFNKAEVVTLKEQVAYQEGQVVSHVPVDHIHLLVRPGGPDDPGQPPRRANGIPVRTDVSGQDDAVVILDLLQYLFLNFLIHDLPIFLS